MKNHRVVALAYDGLCTFEFGCAVEIFGIVRPELGVPWYDFAVHAVDAGPLSATGGFQLRVVPAKGLLERADTIVIPGWRGIDTPVPAKLVRQLRAAHARGARLCSICSGAFVLAAAGLLDGRRATTHWRFASALAERHPAAQVDVNALYVDEGGIVTAAGSAAGLDMLLHLVRSDHGTRVANQVAQRLVLAPHREGGQAQFVPRALADEGQGRIAELMDWVRGHLRLAHRIDHWATRSAMSSRTLQRHFQDATGLSPGEWLTRERLAYARELLESSRLRLAEVMDASGFRSEESFRRHFRRVVGLSPRDYRARFGRV